jgi:ribonuclease-3
VSDEGPPHARHYVVEALVGGRVLGQGEGRSRREAETEAARKALAEMDKQS